MWKITTKPGYHVENTIELISNQMEPTATRHDNFDYFLEPEKPHDNMSSQF